MAEEYRADNFIYSKVSEEINQRVVLVGVHETDIELNISDEDFDRSMDELRELAEASFLYPVGRVIQKSDRVHTSLYVGPGKLDEVLDRIKYLDAEMVIFNDTLSPTQLRNLQSKIGLPVMDRTALILEIFRKRARSREARLQVELARLQYLKPRLIGLWETQNRQGGASGSMSSKGEGETQLELDRRTIDHRLAELRRELKAVKKERETQRKRRQDSRLPLVGLVGYTNAGKSTIMNGLIDLYSGNDEKKVFEADMLFATLDTTVRKIQTGGNRDFLLSDTVGFIHKLPAGLVEAFASTLEEVKEADLLLHVVDCSDVRYQEHMKVTKETIASLGAGDIPVLVVYNKSDRRLSSDQPGYPRETASGVYISAREESSLRYLAEHIVKKVYGDYVEADFLIPYDKGSVTGQLMNTGHVIRTEYLENGTRIVCRVSGPDLERYRQYLNVNAD